MKETAGRGESVWRVLNITACFLVACSSSFLYVFANISPYMTSYLRNVTHGDVDYTDTLWVEQSATITACATMPFLGMLATRIPTHLHLLLGIVINALYLIGTYWTVKMSIWATLLTYGICGGLSRGIFYPTALRLGAQWAVSGKKGFVTGIVLMGFGIGPLAWNPLTTWYVNPNNLEPAAFGDDRYYTQSEVLDKVPGMFLLVGGLSTGIQVLCLLVIRNPPLPQTTLVVSGSDAKEREPSSKESEPQSTRPSTETEITAQERKPLLGESDRNVNVGRESSTGHDNVDYSWKQVLKSRAFWTLWLIIVFTGFALAFFIPLYKAYGETFISDDHFLAAVATLTSVFNAGGRPIWGLLADRFGPRLVFLVTKSFLAILVATFLLCEQLGKVAFLLWVGAMFLFTCGYVTMLPILTLSLFGSRNFNVNTGLVDTSGVFAALLPTLIAPTVKNAYGWQGLFFVGFAGVFIGVMLNLSLELCQCGDSIPPDMLPKLSIRKTRHRQQGFKRPS